MKKGLRPDHASRHNSQARFKTRPDEEGIKTVAVVVANEQVPFKTRPDEEGSKSLSQY